MENVDKPNYFGVIPASVRYDMDLSPNAKLLYSELTCLSNKEGFCFASNKYFADLYNVANSSVSSWVKQLSEKGYIKIEYDYVGKECKQRRIFITDCIKINGGYSENQKGVFRKLEGGIQKSEQGYSENQKDNNTSINNINNNNIRDKPVSRFKKPTVEEIKAYCLERNNNVDCERFYDFYESKDWYVGKNKMKDWRASVRTWERNQNKTNRNHGLMECDKFKKGELDNWNGF